VVIQGEKNQQVGSCTRESIQKNFQRSAVKRRVLVGRGKGKRRPALKRQSASVSLVWGVASKGRVWNEAGKGCAVGTRARGCKETREKKSERERKRRVTRSKCREVNALAAKQAKVGTKWGVAGGKAEKTRGIRRRKRGHTSGWWPRRKLRGSDN